MDSRIPPPPSHRLPLAWPGFSPPSRRLPLAWPGFSCAEAWSGSRARPGHRPISGRGRICLSWPNLVTANRTVRNFFFFMKDLAVHIIEQPGGDATARKEACVIYTYHAISNSPSPTTSSHNSSTSFFFNVTTVFFFQTF